jgi:hypothetical protein
LGSDHRSYEEVCRGRVPEIELPIADAGMPVFEALR